MEPIIELVAGSCACSATAPEALHRQIYARIRDDVLRGSLFPGGALPSSRALATHLGVGRNTVITAYEQLHAEGFLYTRIGSGTRVASLGEQALEGAVHRPHSERGSRTCRTCRIAAAASPRNRAPIPIHTVRRLSPVCPRSTNSRRWHGTGFFPATSVRRTPPRSVTASQAAIASCDKRWPITCVNRAAWSANRNRSLSSAVHKVPSICPPACCSIPATRRGLKTRATSGHEARC